jgi:hypothetical protein
MSSRRLEYNPLFESLADSARRYSKINEEGEAGLTGATNSASQEYMMKYAKEYAKRIVQIVYEQYFYFASSIPDTTLKQKYVGEALEFLKTQKDKGAGITFKELADATIANGKKLIEAINLNTDLINSAPIIKEIYANVESGMTEMENAVKQYIEQYGAYSTSPEVVQVLKDFCNLTYTNLEKYASTTTK